MKKKLVLYITYLVIFIILTGLQIYLFLGIKQDFSLQSVLVFSISIGLYAAVFFGAFIAMIKNTHANRLNENMNEYNIGRKMNFNSFEDFIEIVSKAKFIKKGGGYIVVFSPLNDSVSVETKNSDKLKAFYGYMVDYILEYFEKGKILSGFRYSYCFYQYSFIFYLSYNEQQINKFIEDFKEKEYAIAKEHDTRLFLQPTFGVMPVDNKLSVFDNVHKANVARKFAEVNFETYIIYNKKLDQNAVDNDIDSILGGIKNSEFVVYYQPKFNLGVKQFTGSEALVRWNSPEFGFLSPSRFLSFAENSGIIHELDLYVFEHVCMDIADWRKRGRKVLPVSVNFSLYEFYSASFIEDLQTIMTRYNIDPSFIEIEITEATGSANSFMVVSVLKKIKDLKMRILMDDFGTGFSNINNLRKLPIDVVKIDKSFIDTVTSDVKDREVVKTLISFCHILNLEVIAEGADTEEQINLLRKLKCDTIQGYYYSKPLVKTDYERFIASNQFEKKKGY